VLPSFAVVPMFQPMFELVAKTGGNLAMVVHGAQRVRLHAQLPSSATLTTTGKIRGIYDMRKFAILVIDLTTKDAGGKVLFENMTQIIFRGEGGFGGQTPPKEEKVAEVPKGVPADFRIEEQTTPEQPLLYRLNGDVNPLHADPQFAANVGFTQGPILHGLCTYGYMVRHAAKGACGGDASKITGFEGSFRKPVWPGDTLVTEGWKVSPGKIALQVSVKENTGPNPRPAEQVMTAAWAMTAE